MKKSLLFIPLCLMSLTSCNNASNGFPNPFPDDTYQKVGFTIGENEKTSRVLTGDEIKTLDNTIANIAKIDKFITAETVDLQERDYMRAFAGNFKQGLDASNILKKEHIETKRYFKSESPSPKTYRRKITKSKSESILDYSYGQVMKNVETTSYLHEEGRTGGASDVEKLGDIFERVKTVQQSTYTEVKQAEEPVFHYDPNVEEEANKALSYYLISEKNYLFKSDIHSGADRDDNIILVSESSSPYQGPYQGEKPGYIKFKDEREYTAQVNSINVTKLQLVKKSSVYDEDWYLVKYSRKYSEIAITSDVIEPNVPIKMLTSPIIINYTEEIRSFSIDNVGYSTEPLPELTEEKK